MPKRFVLAFVGILGAMAASAKAQIYTISGFFGSSTTGQGTPFSFSLIGIPSTDSPTGAIDPNYYQNLLMPITGYAPFGISPTSEVAVSSISGKDYLIIHDSGDVVGGVILNPTSEQNLDINLGGLFNGRSITAPFSSFIFTDPNDYTNYQFINSVTLAVPEPASVSLAGIAFSGLLVRRRSRVS